MLIILSPSKTLDFDKPTTGDFTTPDFLDDSQKLISSLRKLSHEEISSLMELSHKLTELNFGRYRNFSTPFTKDNARQAIFAFKGDVYEGLDIDKFSAADVQYADKHLRILSGLYGFLRPLDLIQPYRLEMSIKLKNPKGKNLYEFWDNKITDKLNDALAASGKILVNLASNEYYKAVKPKLIKGEIITPEFKEYKNGTYKMVALFAKRARGLMAAYIIKNRVEDIAGLNGFNLDGYKYNPKLSTAAKPVFTRISASS